MTYSIAKLGMYTVCVVGKEHQRHSTFFSLCSTTVRFTLFVQFKSKSWLLHILRIFFNFYFIRCKEMFSLLLQSKPI